MSDSGKYPPQLRRRARARAQRLEERLPRWVRGLVRRLADRDLLLVASSLAFYGLVSALPLLRIAFELAAAVAGNETVERFALGAAQGGPEGTGQVIEQLASGGSLGLLAVVFTAWPATAYGAGLRRALLRAAGEEGQLPGLRGRLIGLGLVLALPALLLVGMPLMFVLTNLARDGLLSALLGALLALLSGTAFGSLVTALIYRTFAPGRPGWRHVLVGAVLTAAITALFSLAFVVYLNVGAVEERFGGGTVALVVLFGVWLFVSNTLLLAGYETVLELEQEGG